jgi:hypothetical protein
MGCASSQNIIDEIVKDLETVKVSISALEIVLNQIKEKSAIITEKSAIITEKSAIITEKTV